MAASDLPTGPRDPCKKAIRQHPARCHFLYVVHCKSDNHSVHPLEQRIHATSLACSFKTGQVDTGEHCFFLIKFLLLTWRAYAGILLLFS